jgi:hypothetical protein
VPVMPNGSRGLHYGTEMNRGNLKYPQLHDPDWLRSHYTGVNSHTLIAELLGCSESAARAALRRHSLIAITRRDGEVKFAPPTAVQVCTCDRPWADDDDTCVKCGKPLEGLAPLEKVVRAAA